jgi:hypothetical protein
MRGCALAGGPNGRGPRLDVHEHGTCRRSPRPLPRQTELLTKLAAPSGQAAEDAPGVPFLNAIKALTISGYYSTKIGLEQEPSDKGQLFNPTFVGCTHPEHQI